MRSLKLGIKNHPFSHQQETIWPKFCRLHVVISKVKLYENLEVAMFSRHNKAPEKSTPPCAQAFRA